MAIKALFLIDRGVLGISPVKLRNIDELKRKNGQGEFCNELEADPGTLGSIFKILVGRRCRLSPWYEEKVEDILFLVDNE